MHINYKALRRPAAALSALALVVGLAAPALNLSSVSAAMIETRSIKMSDSTPSATGVQYELTFTPVSNAQELIVDFCGDTPLLEATCAFSAATVPTVGAGITSSLGTAAQKGSGSPVHTIAVTGLTMVAATPYTITFTAGLTNPTTAAGLSFYARVVTYTTGTATNYGQADTTGGATSVGAGVVDRGGIALSTVRQVSITARVMETLTFCASGTNIDGSGGASFDACNEATVPTLEIGSGTPKVLSFGTLDATSAYTQLSTNATSGAVIRMKATNACANAGLSTDGGTNCSIPGITDGTYTSGEGPIAMPVNGPANFGLFVADGTATTGISTSTTGNILGDANYNDGVNVNTAAPNTLTYGMDNRNTGVNGVRSTYGDVIATSTAPVSRENNQLVFAATPSLTTPAGIYTGNEILIATSMF